MTVNRRGLLALLGAGAGAAATPAKAVPFTLVGKPRFEHGVASGDPWQSSVVLWTRLSGAGSSKERAVRDGSADGANLSGACEVARDPAFHRIVAKLPFDTHDHGDFTVKLIVEGLEPGTDYWFRFICNGAVSPVGRTKTLPAGSTKDVVLAVASCALYPNGHFNAYGEIAKLDRVDAVIHLGDYIYEYGGPGSYGDETDRGLNRPHDPPHEIVTLADYRVRHAQYKSDPQLQAAHARAPWIVVWDDHETANNSWKDGAENHDPDKGEGDWSARKAAALKAYYEWMPIREPAPGRTAAMANRAFQFGDLASLLMVETRLTARSEQLDYGRDLPVVDGKPDFATFKAKWRDPDRRLIGPDQLAWLAGELNSSVAAGRTWQVIGNQIVMGRAAAPDFKAQLGEAKFAEVLAGLPEDYRRPVARLSALGSSGLPYNLDAWDGYPVDRERVYGAFRAASAHPLVLAGDSHAFWANELHDAGGARVAAEFGATGVTSPGAGDVIKGLPLDSGFMEKNAEVVFTDQAAKGFILLTLTKDQAKAEMIAVSTILDKAYEAKALKTFTVTPAVGGGVSGLKEV